VIHSRYPVAGVEAQDGLKLSSVSCNATIGIRQGSINHLTSINRPSAINSPIKVHTALSITHGSQKASVSSANQLSSSSRAFGTWLNKSKISPCQSHQLNSNQQSLSDQLYVDPDFPKQSASTSAFGSRHSTLQPQATNEKVPASHRSRPAEFRIPRFSWNFIGVVKPTNSRTIHRR
jgi:hypothetical protein